MICCQVIFKPGTYDDDFHRLDSEIDDYARSLAGFDRVEKWLSPAGDVVNAMYYFADRKSVAMLGRLPQHREAKGQVARWYDGYRIVVSDVRATYGDGRLPFADVFPKKLDIEVDFVDITDLGQVRAAVRANTKLVHAEVIANPDLRVADVAALAGIAHNAGALLTVDSTFTPPPMLRPLGHGADLVIHSLTKYYNGRGDAMGGVVIGNRDLVEQTRTGAMWHAGGAISPFNAWLIMRGSTTLPLRLQRQRENAQAVAKFLEADPRVVRVSYPGLPGHDQHDAALSQRSGGFGGVVSFAIGGTHTDRLTFVNDLRVITSAVSLGHDETLVAYEAYPEGPAKAFAPPFRDHGLVRLAIGLEAVEDLIADLTAALTTAYGPR